VVPVGWILDYVWVYFVTYVMHRDVEIAWSWLLIGSYKPMLVVGLIYDIIFIMLFSRRGLDNYLVKYILVTELIILAIQQYRVVLSASS
jgi:hypothetical protein